MHDKLTGSFFISEKTLTGRSYLDMLELKALSKLPPQTILQQEGRRHISATMLGITWAKK
jgi:hypothetical protein